jgi:hypothetical protein
VFRTEAKTKIAEELARGEAARLTGLEGRARVCARRAAGVAVREYLYQRGVTAPGTSAYDLLAFLQDMPGNLPVEKLAEIRQAAGHLLERVNENFTLPVEVDLLEEARRLARALEAGLDEENPL